MNPTRISLIFLIATLLLVGACSEESATDPQTPPVQLSPEINLFEASKEVAPSFEGSVAKTELDPSNPMFYFFNSFRMFDPEIHQGIIDGSNFFRALFDMDQCLQDIYDFTEEIDQVVIEEPFEFGNSFAYDHAANSFQIEENGNEYSNGYAYRLEGDLIHFLVTYQIVEGGGNQVTLGQLQGSYHLTDGDVDLAMVYMVDYNNGESYYVVRNEIMGNEVTHEFELRMVTYDSHGGGSTIVGKGQSQGEGAFFLMKMNGGDGLTAMGERYYVFPSNADEDFLHTVDEAGLQYADLPADVADYKETVQSLVLFQPGDLPAGHVEFNGSNIQLDF